MSLREILQEIHDQRGRLTPALVVETAADPEHPLHHRFEWDDTKAAENFRLVQAGDLIRTAKVRYVKDDGEKSQTRAFIPDRRQSDPFIYAPTAEVLSDPMAAAITLRDFERAIKALRDRYGHLKEYRDLLTREADAA